MSCILLVGNGQPAAATIRALRAQGGLDLAAYLTSEDTPHRDGVHRLPEAIIRDPAELERLGLLDVDWLIVANSTLVIPRAVLASLRGEALNFHPGLLPAYAGLHTHQWAIRNGETEFGVTLHRIVAEIDAGDIVAQERFPIGPDETGFMLFHKCMKAGAELLAQVVQRIAIGDPLGGEPQDLSQRHLYRHADALNDRINWSVAAGRLRDFIRAGNYAPFSSPTYTARIYALGSPPIEVLAAAVAADAPEVPGTIIEIANNGPRIACGAGSLTITQATRSGQMLDEDSWRRMLAETRVQNVADILHRN